MPRTIYTTALTDRPTNRHVMATQPESYRLAEGEGLHLSVRRWTDRNGNTYHSIRVTLFRENGDTEKYGTAESVYGYGTAYTQTARKLLGEIGAIPHEDSEEIASLSHYFREKNIGYATEVMDAKRKKDLHDNTRDVLVTAIDRV